MSLPSGFPRAAARQPDSQPVELELDRRLISMHINAAGDGTALLLFDQVGSDEFWLVDRVVVSSVSALTPIAYVADGDPTNAANLLGGTYKGTFDYDDTNTPYLIESGRQLQIYWQGCTPGALCTARVQRRRMTWG